MRIDHLGDDALVAALKDGPEPFAALYRRYEQPILGYFARRVDGPEVAVDLAAETFAAALEGLRGGSEPRGYFAAWLFGIARHKLADAYRRGAVEDRVRRRLAMEPVVLLDDAAEQVAALAGEDQVDRLVAGLPPSSATPSSRASWTNATTASWPRRCAARRWSSASA